MIIIISLKCGHAVNPNVRRGENDTLALLSNYFGLHEKDKPKLTNTK